MLCKAKHLRLVFINLEKARGEMEFLRVPLVSLVLLKRPLAHLGCTPPSEMKTLLKSLVDEVHQKTREAAISVLTVKGLTF